MLRDLCPGAFAQRSGNYRPLEWRKRRASPRGASSGGEDESAVAEVGKWCSLTKLGIISSSGFGYEFRARRACSHKQDQKCQRGARLRIGRRIQVTDNRYRLVSEPGVSKIRG